MTSPLENLQNIFHVTNLKLRAMTMLGFKVVGLGHLEEEFVIQVVYVCALTPFVLFLIALVVENRIAAGKATAEEGAEEPTVDGKVKAE